MYNEPCTSSDIKSADAAIYAATCILMGVYLEPAAAATTIIIYDNATTNSGTVLFQHSLLANAKAEYVSFAPNGIGAAKGLYADVSGSGAKYILHFKPVS